MKCTECEELGNELAAKWRLYQSSVVEYLRDPANRTVAKGASEALETVAQARLAKDEHRIAAHDWKPL
jgi:hypothetical protein